MKVGLESKEDHVTQEQQQQPSLRAIFRTVLVIAATVVTLSAAAISIAVLAYGFDWTRPRPIAWTVGVDLALIIILTLIHAGYRRPWTGFGPSTYEKPDGTQELRPSKTLWDWLELLIVPLVLAIGGLLFTAAQDTRQQEIENQRAQADALQAYLDQMSTLLIGNDLQSDPKDNVRAVARARTLTILGRFPSEPRRSADEDLKRSVLQFLYETRLIRKTDPIVSLDGANLEKADLEAVTLNHANLSGTNLSGAEMMFSNLSGAELDNARLDDEVLGEEISDTPTHLLRANLSRADLSGANLDLADLTQANLSGAVLVGARVNDQLEDSDDERTLLVDANLSDADLRDADLRDANLRGAELGDGPDDDKLGANLGDGPDDDERGALLSGALVGCEELEEAQVNEDQLQVCE